MVGEAKMKRHSRVSPSPSNGVASSVRELTHDIISLAELELELFRIECRQGRRQLLIPVAMLLAAGTAAVGTAPITLILIAELLVQPGGLSRTAAFLIAALIGLTVSAALGIAGWRHLRRVARAFEGSRDEFTRNITWIKNALNPQASIESQQHHDR
jgi:uncharacterized membrane protein YqjE